MNLWQAVKMAWKSIWGKKGRSFLTVLSIFIGIAAVMTIVSVMDGMRQATMASYAAMGTNSMTVDIYEWAYDENGNDISKDRFPELYAYCASQETLVGITPAGSLTATVIYGTKNTDNMDWSWDDSGNIVGERPPRLFYGSDQYSLCSNLTLARGRDLAYLDVQGYNQVCVLGADAAKTFFGSGNPVNQTIQVNGNDFTVAGVYASRLSEEARSGYNSQMDNFIVFPYTVRRVLGGEKPSEFTVKVREDADLDEAILRFQGFLKGLVGDSGWVYSENQWMDFETQQLGMIGAVLGGIAAISLLVGGIGIMNIMLVTVTERTREIGVRRAIGAQRSSIVVQFLMESAMLCGIGGIMGIAVGTAGSLFLGKLLFQMTIYPSPLVTAGALSLSVALGILFGSYPAVKASHLQPVDALRAE